MELRAEHAKLFGTTAGRLARLLSEAFAPSAQYPYPLLVALSKRDGVDYVAFFDGEVFCGFTYLITRGDITYVLYLAVAGDQRSKGSGSAILDAVKSRHPGNVIVLDIESPSQPATNAEQRLKRRAFYFRNGFHELGLRMPEGEIDYDLLACGRDVSVDEVSDLLQWFSLGVHRPQLTKVSA